MDDWKMEPARDLGLSGLSRARSLRRESGLVESFGRLVAGSGVRAGFRVYNRLEVRGREHLPVETPFVLAANHASHLDALVLASVLPLDLRDRVFPIAAGDVFFENRLMAELVTTLLNTLPVWRHKTGAPSDLKELRQRLQEQSSVYILFPEGTRTRNGTLNRFRPGVGMLVAATPVPVVPCFLQGTFEAAPAGTIIPRPRKIIVHLGQPLMFSSVADDDQGWKHVAHSVETAVRTLAGLPAAVEAAS